VPNDPQSPFVTSGLRIGSPAITTRGFGEDEARQVADWIARVLDTMGPDQDADPAVIEQVRGEVRALCARFPVYQG
jgi:glycine hydroxymethyltransferase